MSIVLPRATLEAMGEVYVSLQQEQLRAGLSRDGTPFPPGVTLIHTGALLASIGYQIDGQSVSLTCSAPYAGILDARYSWFGLCPAYQVRLEEAWQRLLSEGAQWVED